VRATESDGESRCWFDLIGGVDFPIGPIFRLLRSNFSFSEMDYCFAALLKTAFLYIIFFAEAAF
jgi:hypothetical protein